MQVTFEHRAGNSSWNFSCHKSAISCLMASSVLFDLQAVFYLTWYEPGSRGGPSYLTGGVLGVQHCGHAEAEVGQSSLARLVYITILATN